tara:strand:+ start:4249 stop:4674 length:426 start_codon:yes stop_codon:yes gene_type:complete
MTRLKVTTNSNELSKRFEKRADVAEKDVLKLIQSAVDMVHSSVINGIQGPPKTGRTYGNHIASAKGEYPATDTGFLVQNISKQLNRTQFEGKVTSSAQYGVHLEYGTRNMDARPFMFPSLEKNRRKILQRFKDAKLLRRLS